jgi:hypothetical protein
MRAARRFLMIALALTAGGCTVKSNSSGPVSKQGVALDLQPTSVDVLPGESVRFLAAVTGTLDSVVLWSVVESNGGTIDPTGLYTAPAATGTYHVRAAAHAAPSVTATAQVQVTGAPTVTVAVSPRTATVGINGTAMFSATIAGLSDQTVDWSVQEPSGCGTVTQAGVYTAPSAPITCHVIATSHAQPTKSATATVTVTNQTPGSATLQVVGNQVRDTCGNRLLVRGIEQPMWWASTQLPWLDSIAATGANAVRLIVNHADMSWADVDTLFGRASSLGLVFYWSIYTVPAGRGLTDYRDVNYWNLPEVRSLYQKYKKWIVVDVVQEFDGTATAWRDNAISRIQQLRTWGYDCPFDAISNMSGRNLPTLLTYGADVEAADPLHKTIMGWQAYWFETACGGSCCTGLAGRSDWSGGWTYQSEYNMSLCQAIQTASQQTFPIQMGIEKWTEASELQYMDYQGAMQAAQQNGVGWLWWAWTGGGVGNKLSEDGSSLNALGQQVANTDPNGIRNTSTKACGR